MEILQLILRRNKTIVQGDLSATGIVTAAQLYAGPNGIGIGVSTITGPAQILIDPAAVGDDTGTVIIKGDLQVDGTQTIVNSTTMSVDDKNLLLDLVRLMMLQQMVEESLLSLVMVTRLSTGLTPQTLGLSLRMLI